MKKLLPVYQLEMIGDSAGDKMKGDINWNGTNWARY